MSSILLKTIWEIMIPELTCNSSDYEEYECDKSERVWEQEEYREYNRIKGKTEVKGEWQGSRKKNE